jgi:NTE family protein
MRTVTGLDDGMPDSESKPRLKGAGARWPAPVTSLRALAMAGLTALAFSAAPRAGHAAEGSSAAPTAPRPRVGLVLGGGGAKGAAHVGVLSVLEEMRVPIDCIVGTSVGALVGGTFASGLTAAEVDEAIRGISFQQALAFEGERAHQPMRRKLAGDIYSNRFEFGVRNGGLTAPAGFINTQNIEQTIGLLVARSLGVRDFDRLPIPFRAIATDMQTGEMVVLAKGDLAEAMRASMSVPGVFAPVTMDGRVLGDGGLSRNVPVDIARETCADVVIAVSVPNPVPTAEELQSPLTMVMRTIDVLVGANERQQLATLGPDDVSIVVPMGDITSGSFDRANEAIPLGREAALAKREQLARLSVGEQEYAAWRDSTARGQRRSVQLADVDVHGLARVGERYVIENLDLSAGSVVDERLLADRMNRLFALGEFERAEYALRGDAARPTLDVYLQEKSWGPNIVRFDVGLQMGTDSNTAFVLGGDYLRTWINPLGGEVHGQLYFGRTSTFELSLYQPLDARRSWFVEPGILARRSIEDFFVDDQAIARYDLDRAYGYVDVGRVFGNHAELRAGLVSGAQAADRDIADPALPDAPTEGYGGWTARAVFDNRDRIDLPSHGWLGRLSYFHSDDALGSEVASYEKVDALVSGSYRFAQQQLVHWRLAGGTSFDTTLPIYDLFVLGGPISFPGLSLGELRGEDYWLASTMYMHKIAELSSLFGQALYLGFAVTGGDMEGRIDGVHEGPLYAGTLLFGGRTPLGPLRFYLSVASNDDWQVVLGIGRPIEEGAITDPVW